MVDKNFPWVKVAIGINAIADIVDKVYDDTGVEITPENIVQYVSERRTRRQALNEQLGVTGGKA